MTNVTNENKNEIYAALVKAAEEYAAKGQKLNRFKALYLLDKLGIILNRESVDLIEKLCADGFVTE